MTIDTPYILSQVFTIIMYVFLAITYLSKSKRTIVFISFLAIACNAIAFILLNAWTGLGVCAIDLLRNAYLLWAEKKYGESKKITKRDVIFLIIVYLAMIAVSIPTYEGFLSLFSVFASAVYTFSIWQKSTKVYKGLGIPVGILWITYNAYIRSIFGVTLESILLVFSIIGFVRELKGGKKKKVKK